MDHGVDPDVERVGPDSDAAGERRGRALGSQEDEVHSDRDADREEQMAAPKD